MEIIKFIIGEKVIKMKKDDLLIVDPCYIKSIKCKGRNGYDALRCVKVFYGEPETQHYILNGFDINSLPEWAKKYLVEKDTPYIWPKSFSKKLIGTLGMSSGRIWVMHAEYDVNVKIDSGLDGGCLLKNNVSDDVDDVIEKLSSIEAAPRRILLE